MKEIVMTNHEVQMVTLLELVSDNPESDNQLLSKEEQEEVYKRWKTGQNGSTEDGCYEVDHMIVGKNGKSSKLKETKLEYLPTDWKYVFAPVKDDEWRKKLIDLFETLDLQGG